MTRKALIDKKKSLISYIPTVFCLALAVTMILLAEELKGEIYNGFVFSFTTVIPTLFPFFILSDLWSSVFSIEPKGSLSRIFERFFKISGCGISAYFSGLICGFPVGVKVASQLYKENKISRSELEHLCGFVNNPSIAFVISGVGAGMLGSVRLGILLYISVLFSSLIVGLLFRGSKQILSKPTDNVRQSFSIVESIKSAGLSSLNVASCIVFFSGVLGLISGIVKNENDILLFSLFLEVTNAIRLTVLSSMFSIKAKLILTAFALGFSGFSVHLQAFSFLPHEVSRLKYLFMKIAQGAVAAAFVSMLILFI